MGDISNINVLIAFFTGLASVIGILIGAAKYIVKKLDNTLDSKLRGLYDDNRRQYRYQIVDFAGDLHNGIVKTREEFQAIFEIFDRYENLVNKLKVTNHYADNEIAYITEQYKLLK